MHAFEIVHMFWRFTVLTKLKNVLSEISLYDSLEHVAHLDDHKIY